MSFNVCNTDVIPRKKQYGFELSLLTFAATNVRSLTLKCTIVHFNKVAVLIFHNCLAEFKRYIHAQNKLKNITIHRIHSNQSTHVVIEMFAIT